MTDSYNQDVSTDRMSYYDTTGPIGETKALPIAALGHTGGCNVRSNDVEQFAIKVFDLSKMGIKVSLLQRQFRISKEHARRTVKRCCINGILFAPENHKPQVYFPVQRRPQVIEYLYTKKRVLVQPTGTRHKQLSQYYALFNALENQKASNFLDMLRLLPLSPRYIHNFHTKALIDKQYYPDIDTVPGNRTRGKSIVERIGLRQVNYTYYPRGSIMMEVRSSYAPFRVGCENDVNILFAFIGQIKDRMTIHLNDPRERIVPDINVWTLKECDLNVDIELSSLGQVTLQDIQITTFGRVLRAYVKILESRSVYRFEETLTPNLLLLDALDSIAHPNRILENQMKELSSKVDTIIAENSRKSEGKEHPEGGTSF